MGLLAEARALRFAGELLPRLEEDSTAAAVAIAARDLERLDQGILRRTLDGGGLQISKRRPLLSNPVTASSGTGAAVATTSLLCTGHAGALSSAKRPAMPVQVHVAAAGTNESRLLSGAQAQTSVAGRLEALSASHALVSASSLLPAGRAAQILGSPLPMHAAFKRAGGQPQSEQSAKKSQTSSFTAAPALRHTLTSEPPAPARPLAGQKRPR